MFDRDPGAAGLLLGRPANRTKRYAGDRRHLAVERPLLGPDVHGVYWQPARAYYENNETLVVFAPVHPDDLPAGVAR